MNYLTKFVIIIRYASNDDVPMENRGLILSTFQYVIIEGVINIKS